MANVLVTGMTSPQSSKRLNCKSVSFTGAISSILEEYGHTVDWLNPSVLLTIDDLEKYDSIVLGIAPVLSITANKAYGVLSMINLLQNDDRLTLLIDAPEPSKISANLRAVEKESGKLFTPFNAMRKQYEHVILNDKARASVIGGTTFLANRVWPTTIYPHMPWLVSKKIEEKLPPSAEDSLVDICVDSHYIAEGSAKIPRDKIRRWSVDTDTTKWSKSTMSSLSLPCSPMKHKRSANDFDVSNFIGKSIGSLLSPANDGLVWWNHRWVQSLNAATPIASEWRTTSTIGSAWSHLAAGIEEMSYIDMYELSVTQKEEFIAAIPSRDTVKQKLETTLGIHR